MKPRIMIDCDPGLDDALAILCAARYANVVAISSVSGNVDIDKTTHNALIVAQIAGIDAPVFRGAAEPLVVRPAFADHVHGESGLEGPTLPPLTRSVEHDDAPGAILEVTGGGDVTLVPVGPLTNVALAIKRDPTWASRVKEIVLMGGSTTGGNVTAAAEFNFWADPHAAEIVFRSGAPIRMLGLNLTHQVRMGATHRDRLRSETTPSAVFTADLLEFYTDFVLREYGVELGAMHDPCAVLAVTHPELFDFSRQAVLIETEGEIARGMSVVDRRPNVSENDRPILVGEHADGDAVVELIMAAAVEPQAN